MLWRRTKSRAGLLKRWGRPTMTSRWLPGAETLRASRMRLRTPLSLRYMTRPSAIQTLGTAGSKPASSRSADHPTRSRSSEQLV